MTTDETQDSDRKVEAADEEPQPRTDVGAQWTAWQLAEHYNLCMRVNGCDKPEFTWQEIMMLDGYGRDGINLRCLDDVDQYPEIFGPNTKVDKKRVKSTLKQSKDPRGPHIEASKAKIETFLNPPAAADEPSDEPIETETTADTGSSELVEVQGAELEALDGDDGGEVTGDGDVEDPDPLGVGDFLDELLGRDWSKIDAWLKERVEQFKERNFDPKEPNDAMRALRAEIADLEPEFAREVLFELAAPSDRLFPDYRAKLRQTLLLEELLRHDPRYIEVIDAGVLSDIDNLSFRAGQAARALTYGNRRLNDDDSEDGRDELPVISFVDEHRSDQPEETPPTTPEPHADVEPEPPEAPEAEDELDLVLVDVDTSNSAQPEETPPTTPEPPIAVVVIEPPAPEPVVSIADVEPEPPEAPEAEDEPELEDVVDDDSDILAELDGLLTIGRERVAAMAEMGFNA